MIKSPKVLYGVERFFKEGAFKKYQGKKIAFLYNQVSIDYTFKPVLFYLKSI